MRAFLVLAVLGTAAALAASPFSAASDAASDVARGHLPAWALFTFAVSAFGERLR